MAVISTNSAPALTSKSLLQTLRGIWARRAQGGKRNRVALRDPREVERHRARARAEVDRILYY